MEINELLSDIIKNIGIIKDILGLNQAKNDQGTLNKINDVLNTIKSTTSDIEDKLKYDAKPKITLDKSVNNLLADQGKLLESLSATLDNADYLIKSSLEGKDDIILVSDYGERARDAIVSATGTIREFVRLNEKFIEDINKPQEGTVAYSIESILSILNLTISDICFSYYEDRVSSNKVKLPENFTEENWNDYWEKAKNKLVSNTSWIKLILKDKPFMLQWHHDNKNWEIIPTKPLKDLKGGK